MRETKWIAAQKDAGAEKEGKLNCPQCDAKLGRYSLLVPVACSCGAHSPSVPAFCLKKRSLDLVLPVEELSNVSISRMEEAERLDEEDDEQEENAKGNKAKKKRRPKQKRDNTANFSNFRYYDCVGCSLGIGIESLSVCGPSLTTARNKAYNVRLKKGSSNAADEE